MGSLIGLFVVSFFIWLVASPQRRKSVGRFFAASVLLLVLGLLGIGTNAIKLAPLYEYTQHTMRGGSELSGSSASAEVNDKGLQLDYATAWSYGWEELPNMMIPNFNGGASGARVNPDKSSVVGVCKEYGGANAASRAGLGLGRNFMWLTELFFDHVPMYNKFRTVSMALVLLQFTLPMLGFLALDRILKAGCPKKKFLTGGVAALVLTAGFCLLVYASPSIAGSFTSPVDSQLPEQLRKALVDDRITFLRSDALRSMLLIVGPWAAACCSGGPIQARRMRLRPTKATRQSVRQEGSRL